MTLLEIINAVNYLIGSKRPENPLLTPKRFESMLHMASLKHFKRKLGLPEEYQVGMPLPRQAYEVTQKISEDLRPFKVELDGYHSALMFVNGVSSYPPDYYYPLSVAPIINHEVGSVVKRARVVTDGRWDEMHGNYVDIPNDEYPVVNFQANSIRISPSTIRIAKMTYLRLPKKPVYGVTTTDLVTTYNPTTSVQLEWDEPNQIDIMYILLSDLGVSVQRQDIFQIAEKHKAQGV